MLNTYNKLILKEIQNYCEIFNIPISNIKLHRKLAINSNDLNYLLNLNAAA